MSDGTSPGVVWLIGAGPGDPGLITVAGLEALRSADVVIYDRLVNPRLLAHVRTDAEVIYVGKAPRGHTRSQDEINALLVDKARQGCQVARLKGGDPFVFGRGGEEAEVLKAAGIPFVVIPGVTSAVAVPAYAGIPVTHRGYASSFAVITGHEDATKESPSIRWEHLATAVDTIVLLMGLQTLRQVTESLIANGRTPDTPAAAIQQGTTPQQRTIIGTLADIAERAEAAGLTSPTITVVGEAVRLSASLTWFETRPLFGRRVLVTRSRRQASHLAELLIREGAEPIELPTIEIRESIDSDALARAVDGLRRGDYAWVVFTSANGVATFFKGLHSQGADARALAATRIAAIGPATAEALAGRGIIADLIPNEYVAEALVASFQGFDISGKGVLLARAEGARRELADGLRAMGARVEELPLYISVMPPDPPAEALALLRDGKIDVVTFTSSSTVRHLVRLLNDDTSCLKQPIIACIGPVTANTARELGLRVDIVAGEHTIPGLVRALVTYCQNKV